MLKNNFNFFRKKNRNIVMIMCVLHIVPWMSYFEINPSKLKPSVWILRMFWMTWRYLFATYWCLIITVLLYMFYDLKDFKFLLIVQFFFCFVLIPVLCIKYYFYNIFILFTIAAKLVLLNFLFPNVWCL